ncbi:MAG: hypothetical protein FWH47_02235 [Methanomassiliicoccaceae archaeon]|nr:hypothetical protein [Methanomassiliicoccaceae archaeon]
MALFFAAAFALPAALPVSAEEPDVPDETDEPSYVFVPYRDQLDANGRAIFDAMESAGADDVGLFVPFPIALTATADGPDAAEAYVLGQAKLAVDNAFKALRLESPMAYWGWRMSYITYDFDMTASGNTATVASVSLTVSFDKYPKDPETEEFQGIQKMLDDLNAALDEFSTDSETARGKVLDINNYITKLARYDPGFGEPEESPYSSDAYGVFVDPDHLAVCLGYSKAFLLLCEREGIQCAIVEGTALANMADHAWNYVLMDDGGWYAVDVTWNDGDGDKYFLMGAAEFFGTHHQGVYLGSGAIPYPFKSPVLTLPSYDWGPPPWYMSYAWALGFLIAGLIAFALYRFVKKGG